LQTSGLDDRRPDGDDLEQTVEERKPWWLPGAMSILERLDAQLSTRSGPLGRRVTSLSLPLPPTASQTA
ncbi:MAG: hypothetical protein JWO46_427, partial [Nocardioidaceae bacterium]|nr:hypothetical protein [Nocardioidaceae bacterium]